MATIPTFTHLNQSLNSILHMNSLSFTETFWNISTFGPLFYLYLNILNTNFLAKSLALQIRVQI